MVWKCVKPDKNLKTNLIELNLIINKLTINNEEDELQKAINHIIVNDVDEKELTINYELDAQNREKVY